MKKTLLGGLLLCAVACTSTSITTSEPWGPAVSDLQMSIASRPVSVGSIYHGVMSHRSVVPSLVLTVRNVGLHTAHLYLGPKVGGYESPEQVRLAVLDAQGKTHDFRFVDRRYAGIAGGIGAFVVTLHDQESYTLQFALDDFWRPDMTGEATSLRGRLRITAYLQGTDSDRPTRASRTWDYWIGELRSNTLQLER
jgi:hypothetical protein